MIDRFSKQSSRFLRQERKQLVKNLAPVKDSEFYKTRVASISSVGVGDIALFSYNGSMYITLAVSNKRSGPASPRFSAANKKFYSCYLIDHLSEETWKIIVSSINKYKVSYSKIASYKYIKGLFGVFIGSRHYRTFNTVGVMGNLTRFDLKEVLEDKEEESDK